MKNTQVAFTPKPILNWLNESEYSFGKRMSLQRWAWEFLRRNPLYQADYAALRATVDEAEARGEDEDEYMRVYDPPRLDGETEDEWLVRFGGACSSYPISEWYAKEWKLTGGFLPDPFTEYEDQWHLIRFISSPRATTYFKLDNRFNGRDATGSILNNAHRAIGFDVSMPIDPQIKAAREELIRQQKRLIGKGVIDEWPCKNATLQSYPQYLRLLDAQLPNARTANEIAEVIKDKRKGRAEFRAYP